MCVFYFKTRADFVSHFYVTVVSNTCVQTEIEFSDLFCQKSRVDSFLNDMAG